MRVKLLKALDESVATPIRREEAREAVTASRMRILITLMVSLTFVGVWVRTGTMSGPSLYMLMMVGFYWVWFQLLPRIEGRWEREDEQAELRFTELLHKYVDASCLEALLEDLSKRVAKLEELNRAGKA